MANSVLSDSFYESMAGKATFDGPIDFDTDTIYFLLVDATGAAESDATKQGYRYRSSITHESTGAGYSTGGAAVGSLTLTMSAHVLTFSAATVNWAASTITASGGYLYKLSGSGAGSDPLIGYWDFGGSFASSGGTFSVAWNASGILAWSHA
jgi:hypothetical protein